MPEFTRRASHPTESEVVRMEAAGGFGAGFGIAPDDYDPVLLDIHAGDIAVMDYRLNGSMTNYPCDNAVALALRRLVKPDLEVAVTVSGGIAMACIAGKMYALGTSLGKWLTRAYCGAQVRPIIEIITLHAEVIRAAASPARSTSPLKVEPPENSNTSEIPELFSTWEGALAEKTEGPLQPSIGSRVQK